MIRPVNRVAVIGTGVIGASWTALFLAKGLHVDVTDVAPGAADRLREYIAQAWPALEQLGLGTGASKDNWRFHDDMAQGIAKRLKGMSAPGSEEGLPRG